jgi:hypothetical protein
VAVSSGLVVWTGGVGEGLRAAVGEVGHPGGGGGQGPAMRRQRAKREISMGCR